MSEIGFGNHKLFFKQILTLYVELDTVLPSHSCLPTVFCTCQANWRVTTEPSCSKNSSGHGSISARLKLLRHHFLLCFTTKASAKKQKCYNIRCKHIWRCLNFKFNQFRGSSEQSVVDAFEPLLLYELLSDSHLPSLKVAGLCVSLFTPLQACWKYPCQKQESRDSEILQSEALVRSLHSSHILNSKPSKSKCQRTTCQMTTSICRPQPRPSDPKWAKSLSDSETWKVMLIVCFCLENSRYDFGCSKGFISKKCGSNANIYTVQTLLRCHGGDSAKLRQQ